MKRIASFEVNHDVLTPGMYTSRIDGDITTYDVRMTLPNAGVYLEPAAAHTFEHLFATYMRNSRFAGHIIYCGPMGCQTGFYFLVRDLSLSAKAWISSRRMRGKSRAQAASSAAIISCTIWQARRRSRQA